MSRESPDHPPSVTDLCRRVNLSRQAFYKGEQARGRQAVNHAAVVELVRQERTLQPRLGGRKLKVLLAPALAELDISLGRDRFFALLRREELLVAPRPLRPRTTDSRHHFGLHPNLVRHIEPSMPNQVWVADLTYIRTQEGFLYLSLLTDAYSRKIIGWRANDNLEAEGCRRALKMALAQLAADCRPIHHSDRGTQYCWATAFRRRFTLKRHD